MPSPYTMPKRHDDECYPSRPQTPGDEIESEAPTRVNSPSPSSPTSTVNLSLSGSTPAPSRPLSFIESLESLEGPTRVGSPEGSIYEGKEKNKVFLDDVAAAVVLGKGGDLEKGTSTLSEKQYEDTADAPVTEDEFPEGGLRAWLALVGSTSVLLSTFGFSNSFGSLLQYYKVHQLRDYAPSDISWIGSL